MGLKDRIVGLVPDNMREPLSSDNLDGFVELMRQQGADKVTAILGRMPRTRNEYSTQWLYNVELATTGRSGRKIIYRHGVVSGNTQDTDRINDFGGRMGGANLLETLEERWKLTTFVTAVEILRRLRDSLPEVDAVLMNGDKPFSAEHIGRLEEEAAYLHIAPVLEPVQN